MAISKALRAAMIADVQALSDTKAVDGPSDSSFSQNREIAIERGQFEAIAEAKDIANTTGTAVQSFAVTMRVKQSAKRDALDDLFDDWRNRVESSNGSLWSALDAIDGACVEGVSIEDFSVGDTHDRVEQWNQLTGTVRVQYKYLVGGA